MKILFIVLRNVSDCILTLPVLDALRERYPQAKISCLVTLAASGIFINHPLVSRVTVVDKQAKLTVKVKLFFSLSKEKFDLVVDLGNSFFGVFLPAKKRSLSFSVWRRVPVGIKHIKDQRLFWAQLSETAAGDNKYRWLNITEQDLGYIRGILKENNLAVCVNLIIIAPGAWNPLQRWDRQSYFQLIRQLLAAGYKIILVGDKADQLTCNYLAQADEQKIINLCAKTNLIQLAVLLRTAHLVVTNQSAVMHLASYLNIPLIAIFGPNDEERYGPWSEKSKVVKKDIFCRPCAKARCRYGHKQCLTMIKPQEVFNQILALCRQNKPGQDNRQNQYRRILIVRTDRLGDVILSIPVIRALRQEFPQSYIAMMTSFYTKELLEGNPDLDEVIVLDKQAKDKGCLAAFKLANLLRGKKFDLAVVLHPTTRAHLLVFLAGIPRRIGYNRKFGFLLTDRIKHTKQFGQKHESEYALDLVRYLGIIPADKNFFIPLKTEAEQWAQGFINQAQIQHNDKILVIHPTASCPSKTWPAERFAEVADRLIQRYGFKAIIVSGPADFQKAQAVIKNMHAQVLDLTGKTSISQLVSLLRRSDLLISTDSGPMHLASALGVPLIAIFGRSQAGLSPLRWGPVGEKCRVLYKTAGCTVCLAHNCRQDFACLKATSVEDVLKAAEEILF